MATAADIIKGALRKLGVRESESPIEASELADGLEDLNDWASSLEQSTIALGFTPLSSPADTVTIPREAVSMYKLNLALYMAADYSAPIPQTLAQSASDSMKEVLRIFQKPIHVDYPNTLPIGLGNECDYVTVDQKFFREDQSENF